MAAFIAVVDVAGELDAAEVAPVVGQREALHAQRQVVAARVAKQPEAAVQAELSLAELAAPRRRAPEHLRASVRLARAPDGSERPVVVAVRMSEGAGQHGRLAGRRAHFRRYLHGPALRRRTCGRVDRRRRDGGLSILPVSREELETPGLRKHAPSPRG